MEENERVDLDYEIRNFPEAVRMLKFVFDKGEKEKICALQFNIRAYFENLQWELRKKPQLLLVKR